MGSRRVDCVTFEVVALPDLSFVSSMLLDRTKSLALSRISGGTLGVLTALRSDCVVILRRALCFGAAFTYTGPVAFGFCNFLGPAGTMGSGAASKEVSYLLKTDGTGRPRCRIESCPVDIGLILSTLIDLGPPKPIFGASNASKNGRSALDALLQALTWSALPAV